MFISILFIKYPLDLVSSITFLSKTVDLIFLNFLLLSENNRPISPILQAPKIASVTECRTGSPSEWPNVPNLDFIFKPAK